MHQVSISTQNRARAPDLLSALLPVNPVKYRKKSDILYRITVFNTY